MENKEINTHIDGHLHWTIMPKIHNGERIVPLVNRVEETGYQHAKECDWTLNLHHVQKSTENGLPT